MDLVLVFDGLCEPTNPSGYGCWGYVLYIGTSKKIVEHGCLGNPSWMTNNFAEYCSLGFGLKKIVELNLGEIKTLTILGDSQLVVNQIKSTWRLKSEKLTALHAKCIKYLDQIGGELTVCWIPRAMNTEADQLSRDAYYEKTKEKI